MKKGVTIERLLAALAMMLWCAGAFAQQAIIYAADSTPLFMAKGNELYSPDGRRLLFLQQGNIYFSGSNDDRQNIYLMASSLELMSRKEQQLFTETKPVPAFVFSNAKMFLPESHTELLEVKRIRKWLCFYNSLNDSLLAYCTADSLQPKLQLLLAHEMVKRYKVEEQAKLQLQQAAPVPATPDNVATLKPMWGNVTANEWTWDGQILRPRWNSDIRLQWTFDGQTVKPVWGNNLYQQYSWDGDYFKPIWRSGRHDEWSYDGRIFKPTYSTDWATQYMIEGGVVKPWSNVHIEREWKLEGDMPLPLIILVISGMARTN